MSVLSIGQGLRVEILENDVKYLELLSSMLMHLCVCLDVCRMDESKRYIWDFDLFNFIATNINGGCQHNTGSVWGVGATHLVRCKGPQLHLEFCSKYIYLNCDLINYYFDHLIM